MLFPVSGVETEIWLPPLVAFVVSFFTSMGGVSGAFLLLPFQVSFLGYTAPSVSATNQLFNIVAIPGGVWRFIREKRMLWPLTWAVVIGTLPGVVLGAWIRVFCLPDPRQFKFFAGFVLLYIGVRMAIDLVKSRNKTGQSTETIRQGVSATTFTWRKITCTFGDRVYSFSPAGVFLLTFLVGIVGGIYGIGGGAIVAPFFVAIFKLPVYIVAGAALMGTFLTSVVGLATFYVMSMLYPEMNLRPDWLLGLLFGVGGLLGIYAGARCQKYVPAFLIKLLLGACILLVAGKYIVGFFL